MKETINSPGVFRASSSRDAVFRNFDLADSAEGEQQLDQICRWILGSLAHDVADRGGDGRVKENAAGLQSGKIHAHCLSRLKGSHDLPLTRLWSHRPPIANQIVRTTEFPVAPASCRQFLNHAQIAKEPAGHRRY